jgi:nicotinamide-nucleotide amidase
LNSVRLVARFMADNKLVLATGESCTSGLIAATLADVPGAGKLLDTAYVAYTPEAKHACLGVSEATLRDFNLTSEEVARAMAAGVLDRSRSNVAVSNTGVVDAVDPKVAPGTQCFAWAFRSDGADQPYIMFSATRRFTGSRRKIRMASAEFALKQIPYYFRLARR